MTLIDKLTQQIENILHKQKVLESENERLKKQLNMLANVDETIAKLELEKNQHEKALTELTSRLEKLLTI
ncbi:hypothetical protein KKC13_11725 [bacterium]|nr:hypothetical protein [bacterium]MBU1957528.1 hypothetical protein [bacterium]